MSLRVLFISGFWRTWCHCSHATDLWGHGKMNCLTWGSPTANARARKKHESLDHCSLLFPALCLHYSGCFWGFMHPAGIHKYLSQWPFFVRFWVRHAKQHWSEQLLSPVLHTAAYGLIILLKAVSVKAVGDEQLVRRVPVVSLDGKMKH